MAPATAIGFLLAAGALLLTTCERPRLRDAGQSPALLLTLCALIPLLGYLFGATAMYRVALFESVALHTAAAFLLLGLGTAFASPDGAFLRVLRGDTAGGLVAR